MAAPDLNFGLTMDNSTGQTVRFIDSSTDYGVDDVIDYSDVKQTRFLCQNWPQQQEPTRLEYPAVLEKYRQYQKINYGTSVYDNKSISAGDLFIPFVDGLTVLAGDIMETTGIFSPYVSPDTYLPANNLNVFFMDSGYWGFADPIFTSRVYGLQYEIYQNTSPETLANVSDEVQYIVFGTGSDTAEYNENIYRVGEIFIAVDNGPVTFSGTATLKQLVASKYRYYTFIYPIEYDFGLAVINQDCEKCGCSEIMNEIRTKIYGINQANLQQWVSARETTDLIGWIESQLLILQNCED